MRKLYYKTSIRFLVAVLVFFTLALLSWDMISTGLIAYAGDNDLKFDNTSIFDDLYGSKDDNGNEFDLSNYPIDKDGELQFFSFVEYGYSYYANYEKNYALYLYLYNPQQLNFQTDLDANVVRMGVSYTTKDDNIVVSEYEDFKIVCVSRTTGDYANLFYKFKVLDPNKKILSMAQAYEKENGCRRYDIAGVYLKTGKDDVTLDKNIGRTYKCSGYMSTYYLAYGGHSDRWTGTADIYYWDWAYNLRSFSEISMGYTTRRYANFSSNLLPFVFYSPSYTDSGAFNVINKQTVAGDVTSSQIRDYIKNYKSDNYVDWHTSRNLASELFVNAVDSARAEKGIMVGLNKVRTNLGDTFDLKSWNSEYGSWWDKLTQYGWSYPKNEVLDEQHTNVKPFESVESGKLMSTSLASDLLINENDVDSFKSFCNSSYANDEVPYLFRFAVSDYYSRPVSRIIGGTLSPDSTSNDSYIAQETVFLDFNIITMTFKGEEDYYTLAVMHTPVDVISGVEAPDPEYTPGEHLVNNFLGAIEKFWNWLKDSDFLKALKIIGLIIAGAIILALVFKVVSAISKAVKNRKNDSIKAPIVNVVVDNDKTSVLKRKKMVTQTSKKSKYKYRR